MVRLAVLLALIGVSLAAGPAAAQFGNIFGNSAPPRPPADVPNGAFPPQPPPVGYPGQYSPPPGSGPPPSGIQAQPLPPPPGAVAAPPPPSQTQRARVAPQQTAPSPTATNNPALPQPADTAPKPDDTIVTEMPKQKIANGRAVFSGLDKITGRIISFDAAIGETVQFGALQVTARVCYTRPPTEATNTDAFVEVDEVTLKGEIKRIFSGWMFAASPGLHAVEHPIYDVWLTDCSSPVATAQSTAQPAPPAAGTPPPAQQRSRQPQPPTTQPPRRPVVLPIAPSAPAN